MDRQKATGIAAGLTLAAVGGVSAIVLTAGPSIAAAFNGDAPAAVVTTDIDPGVVEPTVVVIDENGNIVSPSNTQGQATNADVGQAAAYDEYEDDGHEDDGHEEAKHEEDEYEEDEYEDD